MLWLAWLCPGGAVSLRGQTMLAEPSDHDHTPSLVLSIPANVTIPVKALHDLPADATALRSWTFLKESMSNIGLNAGDILQVQDDLRQMQADLRTQEQLWRKGKAKLLDTKKDLLREIRALDEDVGKRRDVKVASMLWKERADMSEEQLGQWRKDNRAKVVNERRQEKIAQNSVQELAEQLRKGQQVEMADLAEFQAREGALDKDMTTLIAKKNRLLLVMQKHSAAVAADIQQFNDRLLAIKSASTELDNRIAELELIFEEAKKMPDIAAQQRRLDMATQTLIAAQSDQQEEKLECDNQLARIGAVAESEERKVQRRRQEVEVFCQPIDAQHEILSELLSKCRQ